MMSAGRPGCSLAHSYVPATQLLQSPSSHRTNHLRQDSHLALAPTWLLLYWTFGEGSSVFRSLENIPEAPGPKPASCSLLTSGLMRPQVQKLEFGGPR